MKTNMIKLYFKSYAIFLLVFVTVAISPTSIALSYQYYPKYQEKSFQTPSITETKSPKTDFSLIAQEYVSSKYGIPLNQLIITYQNETNYPFSEKKYWGIVFLGKENNIAYQVFVDMNDGSVIEDVSLLEEAENEAKFSKYGKLEPALFNRLQTMKLEDEVLVAIWTAGTPKRSKEEKILELAASDDNVKKALARSGNPFDIDDKDIKFKVKEKYFRSSA